MGMTRAPVKIGEVVEATTTGFTAQCYELHQPPPFGSLVKVAEPPAEMYGVTCNATTTSIEPGRRPIARGKDRAEEEDIYRENPQLAQLFRTDFSVLIIGHRLEDRIHHYLPPHPARIHSFVYLCTTEEVHRFTQSLDFLNLILTPRIETPAEELVAALLRYASQAHPDPRPFLTAAGKELATLLSGDLPRLNSILRRMRP